MLYLDMKGNGDLSAEKPHVFVRSNGSYRLEVDVKQSGVEFPCRFELTRSGANSGSVPVVSIDESTVRHGTIDIGGRRVPFALQGNNGAYDGPDDALTVDINGLHQRYTAADRYINLFGQSYRFRVLASGAGLTLSRLAEPRPDRPPLTVGSVAPAFTLNDVGGTIQRLDAYRGRLLLIEFWSTYCAPCRREAPNMVKLYASTRRSEVAFLGVSADDSARSLGRFLGAYGMTWPQIREPWEGDLHRLYRVSAIPAFYLIGRKGEILATWQGAGDTAGTLSQFLSGRSPRPLTGRGER